MVHKSSSHMNLSLQTKRLSSELYNCALIMTRKLCGHLHHIPSYRADFNIGLISETCSVTMTQHRESSIF